MWSQSLVLSPAICLGNLLSKGFNNLFAVFSSLTLWHLYLKAFADLPVEEGDFSIDGNRSTLFGAIDELANFLKQVVGLGQIAAHEVIVAKQEVCLCSPV